MTRYCLKFDVASEFQPIDALHSISTMIFWSVGSFSSSPLSVDSLRWTMDNFALLSSSLDFIVTAIATETEFDSDDSSLRISAIEYGRFIVFGGELSSLFIPPLDGSWVVEVGMSSSWATEDVAAEADALEKVYN